MKRKDVFVSTIKAFIAGIVSVIKGVSMASLLLGVHSYENFAKGVGNIPKKKNTHFTRVVIPSIIGIVLGIVAGSKLRVVLLDKYKIQTILFLVGLFLGSIKLNTKKNIKLKKSSVIVAVIITIISVILLILLKDTKFLIENDTIAIIVLGIITGISVFIPSITAFSLGLNSNYKHLIGAYNSLNNIHSIVILLLFILILSIVVIVIGKIMNKLIKKSKNNTYLVLNSLVITNIIILLVQITKMKISFITIITCLITFIWGYLFSINVERE